MKKQKLDLIRCPKCGYEYLAGQIYTPKYFIGEPTSVLRDDDDHIIDYTGIQPDLGEQYTCDKCNTTFNVMAKVLWNIAESKASNFDDEYVAPLRKTPVSLSED